MQIYLAGYNIDADIIEDFKSQSPERKDITPETLSASYARISRDPRPINELRQIARNEVEKARKSNKNIIFNMGHHSVAEHAVFNLDIIDVSRYIIEEIEKFRLCSYTEKSQRYQKLEDDFIIPNEIKESEFENIFINEIRNQNALYHKMYEKLLNLVFAKHEDLAKDKKNHRTLEGWAKEDARYISSLASYGQLGMTINARSLEYLFRRFASSPLKEVQELGQEIYKLAKDVAPSIILFTEANDFDSFTYNDLSKLTKETELTLTTHDNTVRLVDFDANGDNKLLASLLHKTSKCSYSKAIKIAQAMTAETKLEFFKTAFSKMEFYDSVLREFEYVSLTFEVDISSAAFGQLKRHRMMTISSQEYDPSLGITLPESIKEIGMEGEFMNAIENTNSLYYKLLKTNKLAAPYILTNSHRKRSLLKVNARELYHICRLRQDQHSQWDIQNIANKMSALAKEKMPLTFLLLCGKDTYCQEYEKIFNKRPKVAYLDQ
ncbi:MAG: FAD-dependent thymidylate synthase [Pseudomonadota bacterium]